MSSVIVLFIHPSIHPHSLQGADFKAYCSCGGQARMEGKTHAPWARENSLRREKITCTLEPSVVWFQHET